jgi:hypothetical protein
MNISEFAFKLLLLFTPGVFCAFVVDRLTTHPPKEPFFFLLKAFLYGLCTYFFYWGVIHILSIVKIVGHPDVFFVKALVDGKANLSIFEIFFVSLSAVPVALIITFFSQRNFLTRIGYFLRITKQIGNADIWGYTFNLKEIEWVTVRDHVNDLIFDGWVKAFSDDSKNAELLLRDVTVYKNSSGKLLYQVGALYISRDRNNISIEFRTIPVSKTVLIAKENENAEG